MKVIQVSTFFFPSVGGVEKQVKEIAMQLHKRGVNVEVYTTNASHGKDQRMQRLDEEFESIPVSRFRVLFGFGYFFRFAPMLVWKLLRADYDIIHVHNTHDAHLIFALLIKIIRRKKLVLTGHNPYIVSEEKRGAQLSYLVKFYDLVLGLFIRGVDTYVALLESEKITVVKKFGWSPTKVAVIPNGIQDLYYHGVGRADEFYSKWNIVPEKWDLIVGTASRINYVKGLQNLKLAIDKLPKVLFILVGGDGGYLEDVKRLYSKSKNVILTERYVSPESIKDFHAAIDIFLLPSIYEPFGLTIVEAMAQGKMVLASNVGGPTEIIDRTAGELLDPHDQKAWLDRIKYYSQNKEEVIRKGRDSKRVATKYQWEHVISEIIASYKKLN